MQALPDVYTELAEAVRASIAENSGRGDGTDGLKPCDWVVLSSEQNRTDD